MTPDTSGPSATLLGQIQRDLRPVRPSPLPARLALRVTPLAIVTAGSVIAIIGLRGDSAILGPVVAWGTSFAEIGMSVVLIWTAARESTPARRLPRHVVWIALMAAWLMVVAIALWTFATSPTDMSSRPVWLLGAVCGVGGTVAGAFLVLCFAWLLGHRVAANPALAGALYGASAGVAVNAGWRLACPISNPWHTLTAHGAAIAFTTVIGVVTAQLIARGVRGSPDARRV